MGISRARVVSTPAKAGDAFRKGIRADRPGGRKRDGWPPVQAGYIAVRCRCLGRDIALDDSSPARTASAAFRTDGWGWQANLKMSGAESTSIGVTVAAAALIGILDAIGSASVSLSVAPTVLGAEASAEAGRRFSR